MGWKVVRGVPCAFKGHSWHFIFSDWKLLEDQPMQSYHLLIWDSAWRKLCHLLSCNRYRHPQLIYTGISSHRSGNTHRRVIHVQEFSFPFLLLFRIFCSYHSPCLSIFRMSEKTAVPAEMETVIHLLVTEFFLSLKWDANRIYNTGILAFTHIVLRLTEVASTFRTCL